MGREVDDEDECMTPGKVDLSVKAVSISAGDSHTAALTDEGHVFIWGTFRVSQQFSSALLCRYVWTCTTISVDLVLF